MPIKRDSKGFLVWRDALGTPALGIESDDLERCVAEVTRRKLLGVFGTHPYFRERDLGFLAHLSALRSVAFWDVKLEDLTALYELPDLGYLLLSGKRPAIEFSRLQKLEQLVWEHHKHDEGVQHLTGLTFLHSWRFKSPSGDFSSLKLPASLHELGIFWSNAESLTGISPMPSLRRLEIARCRNLKSLAGLPEACPNLEHLVVSASGRLKASEAESVAPQLPRIRHLFAGNRLIHTSPDAAQQVASADRSSTRRNRS